MSNTESNPELERYIRRMPDGDDITLIVLKGHLLIEDSLWSIVRTIIAHGNMLENVRLSFAQLARLSQAMCWGQHKNEMWEIIFSMNSLRNSLAHQLEAPNLDAQIRRVVEAYGKSIDHPQLQAEFPSLSTAQHLKDAVCATLGFLGSYQRDATAYRATADDMFDVLAKVNTVKH